ncbi:MAG: alpha/beta fold hydrolase [Pseudomonadales bacterium]|nr:alpha/beta fold hydrolase [Pseudomonadales bacterium]
MEDHQRDLIDAVYAVALEPERHEELFVAWRAALEAVDGDRFPTLKIEADALRTHLRRAESILSSLTEDPVSEARSLQARLDAEPQAAMAIMGGGRIVALNGAAIEHYGLAVGGRLTDLPLAQEALAQLTALCRTITDPARRATAAPALLRVPRGDPEGSLFVAISALDDPIEGPLALLKTTDFAWPDKLTPLVAEAFGLTAAESEVVRLIVEGASVEDVARRRGRTLATVRAQIRSIYSKTGTRSQSEFVRMAVGLTTLGLGVPASEPPSVARDPHASTEDPPGTEQRRLLELSDGRMLDYADFGDPQGRPVLYLHSELSGDVWPAAMAADATRRGLRIIAPARAGYGRTSPYPAGAINHVQTTADLLQLLDHLGLEQVVALSQTYGGMFTLALARTHPERVRTLIAVAPAFPMSTPDDEAAMPAFYRVLSGIVSRHPELMGFLVRSGAAYIRRVGDQRFLERVFRHCPIDLAALREPAHASVIARGLAFGRTQGNESMLGDYRHLMADAAQALIDLPCPMVALIGSEDGNNRQQRGERLIEAGAKQLRLRSVEGGGQLLFLTHPGAIVDELVAAWTPRTCRDAQDCRTAV